MPPNEKSRTICINIPPDPQRSRTRPIVVKRSPSFSSPRAKGVSHYEELLQSLYDAALITDIQGKILDANARAVELLLYNRQEFCELHIDHVISGADETLLNSIQENLEQSRLTLIEAYCMRKDETLFPGEIAVNRLLHAKEVQLCFFIRHIGRRKQIEEELRNNQAQLIQSEKMAAIGQIAAGVAHEINNPVGFVTSNLTTLTEYVEVFKKLLGLYEALAASLETADVSKKNDLLKEIARFRSEENLPYIMQDVDHLLSESVDGTNRVKEIVQGLKSFARLDESELKEANINDGIEATLRVIWNELKYKCQVHKKLGELPLIRCYPGQLNQVMLNLLVNAAQAIATRGDITIETEANDTHVMIRVSDTGKGIEPEHLSKIFTPFFTTKPVGKGTGLGLSISYGIVQKHKGTIEVQSAPGKGTTFTILLPVEGAT